MRALGTLLVFGGIAAQAAPGTAQIEYLTFSSRVGATLGLRGDGPTTAGTDTKIALLSPTLPAGFRIGTNAVRREGRNDAYLIAPPELNGVEVPLSSREPASKGRVGARLEQELGVARWSLVHEQDVTRSLLAERYFEGTARLGAAEDLTQFGVGYQRRLTDQPESRYVHPISFRTTDRPGRLTEERVELFGERILSESWKARAILHSGRVAQLRPAYQGAELRQSFALTRSFFPQLTIGRLAEGRGDPLEDDRGDAVHTWIDGGTYFQATGRTLLRGAVTWVREEELNRPGFGDSAATLTALTLGFEHTLGAAKLAFTARVAGGDRGYGENLFQGGLTWEFVN